MEISLLGFWTRSLLCSNSVKRVKALCTSLFLSPFSDGPDAGDPVVCWKHGVRPLNLRRRATLHHFHLVSQTDESRQAIEFS
jgi:hypothetical protein